MKRKNESFDDFDTTEFNSDLDSDFIDLSKLRYADLYEDLRDNRNQYLIWLLEEFDIQFDRFLTNVNEVTMEKLFSSAKRLLPYFVNHLDDENRSIREAAKLGLEQIKKRFPELITNKPFKNSFKNSFKT
jgi:hypothetical protein